MGFNTPSIGKRGMPKIKSSRDVLPFGLRPNPVERATAPTRENPLKHLLFHNMHNNDYLSGRGGQASTQGDGSEISGFQANESSGFEAPSFRSENKRVFKKFGYQDGGQMAVDSDNQ